MPETELNERICRVLADEAPLQWDGLVTRLPDDISDDELEAALDGMQLEGRIRFGPHPPGFRLSGTHPPTTDATTRAAVDCPACGAGLDVRIERRE